MKKLNLVIWMVGLALSVIGCSDKIDNLYNGDDLETAEQCYVSDQLDLKLPFKPGNNWYLTCSYGCGYHTSGNNSYYAVDFDIGGIETENGTDIPVLAAESGTVSFAGWQNGYGWSVKIDHGNGYVTMCTHLRYEPTVSGFVHQGQQIGIMGGTGGNYRDHIHFQLYYNGSGNAEPPTPISGYTSFSEGQPGTLVVSDNDLYIPGDHVDDDNGCPVIQYPVIMVQANEDGEAFDLFSAYQKEDGGSLTSYGKVRDDTGNVSTNKGYLRGDFGHAQYHYVVEWNNTEDPHTYIWAYPPEENGGFHERELWMRANYFRAKRVFIGQWDGTGSDDIILAKEKSNYGDKLFWYVCKNFTSAQEEMNVESDSRCEYWKNDDSADGNFGEDDDVFVVADANGNGKVELFRGRENGSGKLDWRRLANGGDMQEVKDDWGYKASQYFGEDVDNDGNDEIIQIQTTQSVVGAFVGHYSSTSNSLSTEEWANDVGGENGWYYFWHINGDGLIDLVRWTDDDEVYWMKNSGHGFEGQSQQRELRIPLKRQSNDRLVFGNFGQVSTSECAESMAQSAGYSGGMPVEGEPVQGTNSDEIYVLKNCELHYIRSSSLYLACYGDWDKYNVYDQSLIDAMPKGEEWNLGDCLPDGSLIHDESNDKIYYFQDGSKRHIPEVEIYLDCGFSWDDYVSVEHSLLEAVPTAPDYSCTEADEDDDQDGYWLSEGDCNDQDPDSNPGSYENCWDGADNDCDGRIDAEDEDCSGEDSGVNEGGEEDPGLGDDDDDMGDDDDASDPTADSDNDGYTAGEDCNDSDPDVHPDAISSAYPDGFWQQGNSGELCWNSWDGNNWGCIPAGYHNRWDMDWYLPHEGKQALDCACNGELDGSYGCWAETASSLAYTNCWSGNGIYITYDPAYLPAC